MDDESLAAMELEMSAHIMALAEVGGPEERLAAMQFLNDQLAQLLELLKSAKIEVAHGAAPYWNGIRANDQ